MQVTLTEHAEELLRIALVRHPEQTPSEIVEQTPADRVDGQAPCTTSKEISLEDFDAGLDRLAQFSAKIPFLPDEAFTREGLYLDHD